MRAKLFDTRAPRVRPGLDDKVLADWNGLMIAALVNAGLLLDEPGWLDMAARAFDFIARGMTRGDRLGHSWREGKLKFPGLASDFAAMIRAALALYEATGEGAYLDRATIWQHALERHYTHENGGYYLTADDADGLVVRPMTTSDDATPNAHGLAAQNLVRLSVLTGDEQWRARADRLFDGVLPVAAGNLFAHLGLLNALDLRLHAAELVVVGEEAERFAAAALKVPYLNRIVLRAKRADDLPPPHPARAAFASARETAVLVCVGETCSLPVADPAAIAETVQAARGRKPSIGPKT
jgi:uncharacterized protein